MNMLELSEHLKTTDSPRATLIGILSNSQAPATMKAMGYAFLNAASSTDIEKLKLMFLTAVNYITAGDEAGLKTYLMSIGMDGNILNMIMKYATNPDKNK